LIKVIKSEQKWAKGTFPDLFFKEIKGKKESQRMEKWAKV